MRKVKTEVENRDVETKTKYWNPAFKEVKKFFESKNNLWKPPSLGEHHFQSAGLLLYEDDVNESSQHLY